MAQTGQQTLLPDRDLWHDTLVSKLTGLLDTTQFENLKRCGHEKLYQTCRECGIVTEHTYRCWLKWCPRCQWMISATRAKKLTLWAATIEQPKHLVLTERNSAALTPSLLAGHLKRLRAFRRSACFRNVRGGCVTVELTNESRGWHLHSHWLVDVDWLEPAPIAARWGQLAGQDYAIVRIKDARALDYQIQVAKYVVKPAELVSWDPYQILEFVTAIRGKRFFFQFGSLLKARDLIRKAMERDRKLKICACGCCDFTYETETQTVLNEIRREERSKRRRGRKRRRRGRR